MELNYQTANTKDVTSIVFDTSESNEIAKEFFKRMYSTLDHAFIVEPSKLKDIKYNLAIPCIIKNKFADQDPPFNKTDSIYTSILSMLLEYDDDNNCDPAIMYRNDWDSAIAIVMSDRCFEYFVNHKGK